MSKDDAGLAMSYGFQKVITLPELMSLYPEISPMLMVDFYGSQSKIDSAKSGLLARFGMTEGEFKAQL